MRIAIVASTYVPVPPPQYGGSEQVIYYLIRGLQELGHTPILLAPGDSTVDCEILPIVDTAIGYPRKAVGMAAHARREADARRRTLAILQQILPRVDIVHSHGFDVTPLGNFPTVTTLHNMFEFSQLAYFRSHTTLPYVAISENQRRAFPGLHYVGTVYHGEDPDLFPLVKDPEPYLCFLGRFDWDKRPHIAIELALALNMKIKLSGKIDYKGERYVKEKLAPYLDNPLVECYGELNFEEKVRFVGNAVCNLHPANFREPFGLVVLEAAYCGTPTLATARGAVPEIIEPGRTGMLVEDFVEGIAAIEQCFTMDRWYIAMRTRERFNYLKMTQDYLAIYESIIGGHHENHAK